MVLRFSNAHLHCWRWQRRSECPPSVVRRANKNQISNCLTVCASAESVGPARIVKWIVVGLRKRAPCIRQAASQCSGILLGAYGFRIAGLASQMARGCSYQRGNPFSSQGSGRPQRLIEDGDASIRMVQSGIPQMYLNGWAFFKNLHYFGLECLSTQMRWSRRDGGLIARRARTRSAQRECVVSTWGIKRPVLLHRRGQRRFRRRLRVCG